MSLYIVTVSEGELRGKEVFRTEVASYAIRAADNYKRDTGKNCDVESRTTVYTTTTLEESLAAEADARTKLAGYDKTRTMGDRMMG